VADISFVGAITKPGGGTEQLGLQIFYGSTPRGVVWPVDFSQDETDLVIARGSFLYDHGAPTDGPISIRAAWVSGSGSVTVDASVMNVRGSLL
jgi:hypothetical protein